ncbi:MAG: hypothetical protein M3O31_01855, partial [Acidobacteriota bacterium]|nr:hypothetical protein [Acidobacteriota bacterium]
MAKELAFGLKRELMWVDPKVLCDLPAIDEVHRQLGSRILCIVDQARSIPMLERKRPANRMHQEYANYPRRKNPKPRDKKCHNWSNTSAANPAKTDLSR